MTENLSPEAWLNPRQQEAVRHLDGPALVLAGAGSGKTRVITHRIAALVQRGTPAGSILALTFTNKAAREMRDRAEQLTGHRMGGALITTFHSACARWLRQYGRALGLTPDLSIYDGDDQLRLLKRVAAGLELPHDAAAVRAQRARVESFRSSALTPAQVHEQAHGRDAEETARLFEAYEATLASCNAVDFGALIVRMVHLLESEAAIRDEFRRRWQWILVDEFQDTDAAQYRLLRALAPADGNIAVVGDDDQSIYGWRGATVENVQSFTSDFPAARTIKLEQNYRSSPEILDTAHAVVADLPGRIPKRLFTERVSGPPVRLFIGRTDREEADWLVRRVEWLRRETPVSWSDVAVFFRTNAQSRIIEERFRATGIPHVLVGGVSFYERREVRDILAYLRLATNPLDDEAFLRVVNTPSRGIGPATVQRLDGARGRTGGSLLAALATLDRSTERGIGRRSMEGLCSLRQIMDTLQRAVGEASAGEMVDAVLVETRYGEALEASSDPESAERVRNLEELRRAAHEFDEELTERSSGTAAFLESVTLRASADDVGAEEGAVQLMTVHMSKGLEFPVVFVTGLEDGRFPLKGRGDRIDDESEERRLFYVAITRARERLHLSAAGHRHLHGQLRSASPSPFLELLPEHLVEKDPDSWQPEPGEISGALSPRSTRWGRGAPADEFDQRPLQERLGLSGMPSIPEEGVVFDDSFYPDEAIASARALVGRRARHSLFGEGEVVDADPSGARVRLTIRFPEAGEKRVILDYVELL